MCHLGINQLDDVLLASEALQQSDLIHKALAGFRVLALQLDALQGKNLAIWRHHLEAYTENLSMLPLEECLFPN